MQRFVRDGYDLTDSLNWREVKQILQNRSIKGYEHAAVNSKNIAVTHFIQTEAFGSYYHLDYTKVDFTPVKIAVKKGHYSTRMGITLSEALFIRVRPKVNYHEVGFKHVTTLDNHLHRVRRYWLAEQSNRTPDLVVNLNCDLQRDVMEQANYIKHALSENMLKRQVTFPFKVANESDKDFSDTDNDVMGGENATYEPDNVSPFQRLIVD